MTSRRTFIGSMLTLAAVPLISSGQACCAADKDAKKAAAPATPSKFKAASAVVGESNEKKTKIKIKCVKCGHLCDEIEIDTPTADKPYTQEWTCPKCGKKQTVKVEVAKPE
jgi:predicted nucleic-acid-binding Zn-ribbon protein